MSTGMFVSLHVRFCSEAVFSRSPKWPKHERSHSGPPSPKNQSWTSLTCHASLNTFSSSRFINQEKDGSSTTELWGWSQQGPVQEEPQGEIPLQFMIWALQNGLYSDRSSAQCSSAHTSQLLQCKTPFLPLIFLILNSLRKELGSLTHMPSVGELTCMLQTGGVPGLLLTEKWVLPLWSCFEFV